ncbi:MAG: AsmA family protein [Proteobacteria bacterium]|nr:AsmA family protein [Pseudomonadota bacterium]
MRRALIWTTGVAAALIVGVGVAESIGWPFLAGPAAAFAAQRLERSVELSPGAGAFRLHLLGGIRLHLQRLVIGNPSWSQLGPMLDAQHLELKLRWRDLWAAHDGRPLRLQALSADALQLQLERLADGRASWQFGKAIEAGASSEAASAASSAASASAATAPAREIQGVQIADLRIGQGRWTLADAQMALRLEGNVASQPPPAGGWLADATGSLRQAPVTATLRAGAALTDQALGDRGVQLPLTLDVQAGQARLHFDGRLQDPMDGAKLDGSFGLSGPSLAAVGQPLRLTLPTTAAFSMQGRIQHAGTRWQATVRQARIGRSDLAGDFAFDTPPAAKPVLSGELRGRALWLQDLGPAIGTRAPDGAATPPHGAKVLPDRPFDLPSLNAMQAEVGIALDRLELGHPGLEAVQPLRAHLSLKDGVLLIDRLDARLARGRLDGHVRLDGRSRPASWDVDLGLRAVELAQWISGLQRPQQPPYVAGRLAGRVQLKGRGNSTSQLLASADGRAWGVLSRGRISHLAVELAGLDVAQALGVALRGDDALRIDCGAADLAIANGRVQPRVLVVDTRDSTVWAEGSLSLADERLDLVARVEPKDFSPLALRSPLRVRGTLGAPKVSVDKAPLARRLVPAALLGMLNPLAALLPLMDAGDDDGEPAAAACRQVLAKRGGAAP